MRRLKTSYVSPETINEILKWTEGRKRIFREINEYDSLGPHVFISDKRVEIRVTCIFHGEVGTFACRKDGRNVYSTINGLDAYILLAREYSAIKKRKIPNWAGKVPAGPQAILAFRKGSEGVRQTAYGYDMRKAYCWGLMQKMPATEEIVGSNRRVEEGEIGFYVSDWEVNPPRAKGKFIYSADYADALYMASPGQYAQWIFREEPSPFVAFAKRWFDRGLKAEDPIEKQRCKDMVNFSVGYLQRVNPFIRATVIERINNKILDLMDERIIYCNTDSLISEEPLPFLDVGPGCGQWKLEHDGETFAHVGFSYQWGFGGKDMHYRSIPASWFREGADILSKDLPGEEENLYYYDAVANRLKERKHGEEKN